MGVCFPSSYMGSLPESKLPQAFCECSGFMPFINRIADECSMIRRAVTTVHAICSVLAASDNNYTMPLHIHTYYT